MKEFLSLSARLIEVILFIENEPVEWEQLQKLTKLDDETLMSGLEELKSHFSDYKHALELVESNGTYRLLPSSDLHTILRDSYGK